MKSRVAVVLCEDYEPRRVDKAIALGLDLLGGARSIFHPGEKMLLKPNLLAAEQPERAVTTHPQLFRALALLLQKAGLFLSYGDSPAIGSMDRVAKACGLAEIAEDLGIEAADFKNGTDVYSDDAVRNRRLFVARAMTQCDGFISIPKLKTHGLMRFTGAVKNQFGCIPGLLKGEYHLKLPDQDDFARMLVDINLALKARLFVLDGIVGMEGNGPRGGKPKNLGIILLSRDPVALDATACRWLGIRPDSVPTIRIGNEAGLGECAEENIEILGEVPTWAGKVSFASPRPARDFSGKTKWIREHIVPRPVIDETRCKSCGICLACCPQKPPALAWPEQEKESLPLFDYKRCLRCYCCQELCPEGAITLYTPRVGRVFNLLRPPNG